MEKILSDNNKLSEQNKLLWVLAFFQRRIDAVSIGTVIDETFHSYVGTDFGEVFTILKCFNIFKWLAQNNRFDYFQIDLGLRFVNIFIIAEELVHFFYLGAIVFNTFFGQLS